MRIVNVFHNFVKTIYHKVMKTKLLIALLGIFLCLGGTSCVVHRHAHKPLHKKEIPPGHAKKIRGKNRQSLMLPDITNIVLLKCRRYI